MNRPLPKLKGVKPRKPMHELDRLIFALEDAKPLYARIRQHSANWHAEIGKRPQVRLNPKEGGPGTPLREFKSIDPMGEWMPIDTEKAADVSVLEKQGLIAVINLNGQWLARAGVGK